MKHVLQLELGVELYVLYYIQDSGQDQLWNSTFDVMLVNKII